MFSTLLESKSRTEHSAGGTVASITAHAAVVALAVLATAQASHPPRTPPDVMRTVYFPRLIAAPETPRSPVDKQRVLTPLPPIAAPRLNVDLPPIDVSTVPTKPVDFPVSAPSTPTGGQSPGEGNSSSDAPFLADQVEKQVSFIAGSASPRYPDALRSSGVEGKVIAVFVVDERGRAEVDSVRFLSSNNQLFVDAVRAVLPRMRFVPAEIGGRKVRQLVQMPFVFTIGR